MAHPTWPLLEIPRIPLYGSHSETLQPFVSEFEPDVGPANRWPRSSKIMINVSMRLFITAAQRVRLIAFYRSDCKAGALPFTMGDPVDDTAQVWYWAEPPAITGIIGRTHFNADLRLRKLA